MPITLEELQALAPHLKTVTLNPSDSHLILYDINVIDIKTMHDLANELGKLKLRPVFMGVDMHENPEPIRIFEVKHAAEV